MHIHVACVMFVFAMHECAMGLSASLGMRRNEVSLNDGAAASGNAGSGEFFGDCD